MSDHIAQLTRYSGSGPMLGVCLDSHGFTITSIQTNEVHAQPHAEPLGPHYHDGWTILPVAAGTLFAIDGNGAAHPLREVRYEPGEEIARWRLQ